MSSDLGKGFSIPPDGGNENDKIMHPSGYDRANKNPEKSGKITKLGGQDWSDEGASASDSREMMPEKNPLVGRIKIFSII
jgi:hypothetical protein